MPRQARLRKADLAHGVLSPAAERERQGGSVSCHLALWRAPAENPHLTPQTPRHCARLPWCMLRWRWQREPETLHASRHLSVPHPHTVLSVVAHTTPRPCAPAAQLWAAGQARGAPGALAGGCGCLIKAAWARPGPQAAGECKESRSAQTGPRCGLTPEAVRSRGCCRKCNAAGGIHLGWFPGCRCPDGRSWACSEC